MVKLIELPDFIERRREYTISTDFMDESPRSSMSYEMADKDAGADIANIGVWSTGTAIYIHDIGQIPAAQYALLPANTNTAIFGVNVTNNTSALVVKTYQTDVVYPEAGIYNSLYTDGTATARYVAAQTGIWFYMTQVVANIAGGQVTLSYSDATAYPVAGFGVLAADGGTAAITNDGVKRIFTMTTDATDNDEIYLFSTGESFKFIADKPFVAEAYIQYTEANTNDANIIFGLMDAVAADALVDDGAGPKASYSGAVIFKVDGETVWRYESSITTTQVPATGNGTVTTTTAGSASAYQRLRIEYVPTTTTGNQINFFVDGVQIGSNIQTLTSAQEMQLVLGVKAGGGNAEALNCDYIGCSQLR